ncbi:MAG: LysE family transporter [Halanaerobiales bacterium]|nr:LysE family transporter [Halanaerobiales bacterium]
MFNIIPLLSYVFVVTFTPGPNNIMSMVNANTFGYRKTLKFILGVFTGFSIIMLLSSYFNLLLLNVMPKVKFFMSILGALYMTYLAYKIIISSNKSNESKKHLNSFYTGISMQFVNPKVILYGITVMSNFIIPYYKSNMALIFFSVLLATVALLSTSCWALFGVIFQKFLSRYRKPFNIAMGLLLIYSAISIVVL